MWREKQAASERAYSAVSRAEAQSAAAKLKLRLIGLQSGLMNGKSLFRPSINACLHFGFHKYGFTVLCQREPVLKTTVELSDDLYRRAK